MRSSVQLAVLVALLALAVPVTAQDQLAPVIAITPPTAAVSLADNQTQEFVWTVTNSGPTNAQTTLQLEVPSGWSAQLVEPTASTFTLNGVTPLNPQPGTQVVRVLVAPGAGAANATLSLSATGTNQAGQSSSAEASATLTYIPPPPPPPPGTPWGLYAGIAAGVVILVLVALYLVAATRPRLKLNALALEEYAGTRASVSVLIENRSSKVRKIDLRVRGLGQPWSGALMVPYVLLDAKSSTDIPLSVSIPFQGKPGDHRVVHVEARPHGPFPWLVRRRVSVTIMGPRTFVPSPLEGAVPPTPQAPPSPPAPPGQPPA